MELRTIPYGYTVENGITVPHSDESKIVQRIFNDYLGGESLLRIAQTLTAEGVKFLPGRCDWNKNRVKRILEDERYLGTDTYPAIINEDMHRQAQAVKDSNNNQHRQESEIPATLVACRLPCTVECSCGAKMTRRHDSRRKVSQELWTCQDPDCKRVVNINDDILLAEITGLLNRLIRDPSIVRTYTNDDADPPIEVRRLQNEVSRQLDGFDFEQDEVKAAIFSLAEEKYRQTDEKIITTKMMRAEFEQQTPLSHFSLELLKRTTTKIQFDENGNTVLVLKNNQYVRKEQNHADHDYNGNTSASNPSR